MTREKGKTPSLCSGCANQSLSNCVYEILILLLSFNPTLREKSDVDEPRLHEDLWQHEAEGRDDVDEGRRGAAVVPRGPHEPARPSQDGGRVHGAGAQLVAQLVAVVG